MKRILLLIPLFVIIALLSILFLIVLIGNINPNTPKFLAPMLNISKASILNENMLKEVNSYETPEANPSISPTPTPTPTLTITPSPTPTPFLDIYGCSVEMMFTSGPLEGEGTTFTVLGEDYFSDKGDKFDVGKNTAVFYQDSHNLILHSGFDNGNIFKPLEAEFIRSYLESWGIVNSESIQEKISSLNGSTVDWYCNQTLLFHTRINFIVRLSHIASNRLWLEPENLIEILELKEGEPSEWIGNISWIDAPNFYLNFCGWGPWGIGEARYTYYRYLVNFEILP